MFLKMFVLFQGVRRRLYFTLKVCSKNKGYLYTLTEKILTIIFCFLDVGRRCGVSSFKLRLADKSCGKIIINDGSQRALCGSCRGVVRWRRRPAPLATSLNHDSLAASSTPPQKLAPLAFPTVTKPPKLPHTHPT